MVRGGVVIELGRELNAERRGARLLMLIGFFACLFGAVAGATPLAIAGLVLLFSVGGLQAAAALSERRPGRRPDVPAPEHALLRDGRAAWSELPSEARVDARPVLDSLARYVEASRVAPHDAELVEQARTRHDALVELRDAYRSLRARELVAGGDMTDVATARLLAEKVREVAAEIEQL